jgi:hypothetical protein
VKPGHVLGDRQTGGQAGRPDAEGLRVVRVSGAGSCDWGTPERLMKSLAGTRALVSLNRRLAAGPRHAVGLESTDPRAVV